MGSRQKASRVDGDDDGSPCYYDASGLNPEKGYEFRVTGHTPQCKASPWSEVAVLWLAPDPPAFSASVGNFAEGASV